MQPIDIDDMQNTDTLDTNSDILKSEVRKLAKIIQLFVPLISSVFIIVSEAVKIYENAKICDYKAFYQFVEILKKMKDFMNNVSNLLGWKKYALANSVHETFTQLISKFDKSMDDLYFTITISNEQQRKLDQENLNCNIEEMKQFLEIIARGVTNMKSHINTVINEVQIINKRVDHLIHDPINNMINLKAVKINPKDFEMLLWELIFEKIPYKDFDMNTIMNFVKDDDCEKITFGQATLEYQKLQKGLKKTIIE
ncbi:18026_t:CDS:2, partial [Racocetra persica]